MEPEGMLSPNPDSPSRRLGQKEDNLKTNYENWMTWIVLSLCGMLLLIGVVKGALEKG
jgi:hypothetical protein